MWLLWLAARPAGSSCTITTGGFFFVGKWLAEVWQKKIFMVSSYNLDPLDSQRSSKDPADFFLLKAEKVTARYSWNEKLRLDCR